MSDEQLRGKLDDAAVDLMVGILAIACVPQEKIDELKADFIVHMVTGHLLHDYEEAILAAIEEGIIGCAVCAGLGVSNPSDFREDKPMLVKGLCPNCGGKGWLI